MLAVRFIDPIRYSCETAHHCGSDRRYNHVYHSCGRPMDVGRNRSGCDGRNCEPQLIFSLIYEVITERDLFSAHRGGIVLGTFLGLPSYAVNWLVFRELLRFRANELHAASRMSCSCFSFPGSIEPLRYRAPRRKPV
jgi:hypothetical protein